MRRSADRNCRQFAIEAVEHRLLFATQLFPSQGPATENYPSAFTRADFNNDGAVDLAIIHGGGNAFTVLLQDGNGDFPTQSTRVFLSSSPKAVVAADFNGDGRADLAICAMSLQVFFGKGDGTFTNANLPSMGGNSLAAGDFNADGKADLAMAGGQTNAVQVLTNIANGSVTSAVVPVGVQPTDVSASDLNGDGKPDLALAGNNAVAVVLGTGPGTFATPTTYSVNAQPEKLSIADMNRDGRPDIAVTSGVANGGVSVLLGNGNGTFGANKFTATGSSPRTITSADFDGDGFADLVLADQSTSNISILKGLGTGYFSTTTISGSVQPYALTAYDFTADGKTDLAVCYQSASYISILAGNGDGTFVLPNTAATTQQAIGLATADFNEDGRADIATANLFANSVSIRLGNGDGTFVSASTLAVGSSPQAVVAADLNGDGHIDLVSPNKDSNTVSVLIGDGTGAFSAAKTFAVGTAPRGLTVRDLNGDGRLDLAVANSSSNNISVLINNGNAIFTTSAVSAGIAPYTVQAGDFNGDGLPDLVTGNNFSNTIYLLLNKGNGTFTASSPITISTTQQPQSVAVADFNRDGKLDLAVAGISVSGVSILKGKGDGTFDLPAKLNAQTTDSVIVADVNADGFIDILSSDNSHHAVTTWLGNGDGTFKSATRIATGINPSQPAVSDFNGDGKADVATANLFGNSLSIFFNQQRYSVPYVQVANGVLSIGGTGSRPTVNRVGDWFVITSSAGSQRLLATSITQIVFSNMTADVNTDLATSNLNVTIDQGASVNFSASEHLNKLIVNGQATFSPFVKTTLSTHQIAVGAVGSLDLAYSSLLVDYSGSVSPSSQLAALIKRGWNGGAWNGTGLSSSTTQPETGDGFALNVMEASEYKSIYGTTATFAGEQIDDTAVLVKYATYGDSNFDGKTDFNDFLNLQNAFGQSNKTSFGGDFDYSGTTDFNDFLVLQNHFGATLPVAAAAVKPPPVATASISGVAFNDSNRNGKYDKGDSLAAGKTVWLDLDDDGVKDASEPSAVTDAKGRYAFKNLAAGTYHVRRVFPKGYLESTKSVKLLLSAGQALTDVAIGSRRV